MTKPNDWLDVDDFADATFDVDRPAEPSPSGPARFRWKLTHAASHWDATFRIELRQDHHERDEK